MALPRAGGTAVWASALGRVAGREKGGSWGFGAGRAWRGRRGRQVHSRGVADGVGRCWFSLVVVVAVVMVVAAVVEGVWRV